MHRSVTDSRKESHGSPTRKKLETSIVGALELYPIDQEVVQRRRTALLRKLSAHGLAQNRPAADDRTSTSGVSVAPETQLPTNEKTSVHTHHSVPGFRRYVTHSTSGSGVPTGTSLHFLHHSLASRRALAKRPDIKARVQAETLRSAHRLIAQQLALRRPEAEMNRAFAASPRADFSPSESEASEAPEAPESREASEAPPDFSDTFITALSPAPPAPGPLSGPHAGPPRRQPPDADGVAAQRRELLRPFLQGSSPRTLLRGLLQPPVAQLDAPVSGGTCEDVAGRRLGAQKFHRPLDEGESGSVGPGDDSQRHTLVGQAEAEPASVAARRLVGVPDHNRGMYAGLRALWEREHQRLVKERNRIRAQRVRTGAWWRLAHSTEGMAASARKAGLGVETYGKLLGAWNAGRVDMEAFFSNDSDADEMRETVKRARRIAHLRASNLATPSTIARLMSGDVEIEQQIDDLIAENPSAIGASEEDFHSLARSMLEEKRRAGGKRSLRNDAASANSASASFADRRSFQEVRDSAKSLKDQLSSNREGMEGHSDSFIVEGSLGTRDKDLKDSEMKGGLSGFPSLRVPDKEAMLPFDYGELSGDAQQSLSEQHILVEGGTLPFSYGEMSAEARRKLHELRTSSMSVTQSSLPPSSSQRRPPLGATEQGNSLNASLFGETLPPSRLGSYARDGVNDELSGDPLSRKTSEWWGRRRVSKARRQSHHVADIEEEQSVDKEEGKTDGGDGHGEFGKDIVPYRDFKKKLSQHRRLGHPNASDHFEEAAGPSVSIEDTDNFNGTLFSRSSESAKGKSSAHGLDSILRASRRHSLAKTEGLSISERVASRREQKKQQESTEEVSDGEILPMDFASLVDTGSDLFRFTPGDISSMWDQNEEGLAVLCTFSEGNKNVELRKEARSIIGDLEASGSLLADYAVQIQPSPEGIISQLRRRSSTSPPLVTKEEAAAVDEEAMRTNVNFKKLRERFVAEAREEYKALVTTVESMRERVVEQEKVLAECRNDMEMISNPLPGEDRDAYAVQLTHEVNEYARTNQLDLQQLANTAGATRTYEEAVRTFLESFALTRGRHAGRDVGCQCSPQELGHAGDGMGGVEEQMADLYYHSRKLAQAIKMTIASIGNVMSFHSLLELESTCKRCFFIFEDPRTLWPCGHTFCQSCLADMFTLRGDLICNECGSTCSVGYTPNLSLELLASYQVMQRSSVDNDDDGEVGVFAPQRRTIEGVLASLLHDFMSTQHVLMYAQHNEKRRSTMQLS